MQETQVRSLGREDPQEKEMATHSSSFAWRIPWMEKPGGLRSMGLQRVRHDWATNTFTFTPSIRNMFLKAEFQTFSPCFHLKCFPFLSTALKVTFHWQSLQNLGCIPRCATSLSLSTPAACASLSCVALPSHTGDHSLVLYVCDSANFLLYSLVVCVFVFKVKFSVSDSLWPHGLYSPWNSPGQNTGVGSLSLLQGIFPTQGSNLGLPHCRQILYQLSHKGSPVFSKNSSYKWYHTISVFLCLTYFTLA